MKHKELIDVRRSLLNVQATSHEQIVGPYHRILDVPAGFVGLTGMPGGQYANMRHAIPAHANYEHPGVLNQRNLSAKVQYLPEEEVRGKKRLPFNFEDEFTRETVAFHLVPFFPALVDGVTEAASDSQTKPEGNKRYCEMPLILDVLRRIVQDERLQYVAHPTFNVTGDSDNLVRAVGLTAIKDYSWAFEVPWQSSKDYRYDRSPASLARVVKALRGVREAHLMALPRVTPLDSDELMKLHEEAVICFLCVLANSNRTYKGELPDGGVYFTDSWFELSPAFKFFRDNGPWLVLGENSPTKISYPIIMNTRGLRLTLETKMTEKGFFVYVRTYNAPYSREVTLVAPKPSGLDVPVVASLIQLPTS